MLEETKFYSNFKHYAGISSGGTVEIFSRLRLFDSRRRLNSGLTDYRVLQGLLNIRPCSVEHKQRKILKLTLERSCFVRTGSP
jgi:hypothetical protein